MLANRVISWKVAGIRLIRQRKRDVISSKEAV
jgi:hypothetical protein